MKLRRTCTPNFPRSHGFTLLEILVVIAIFTLLGSMALMVSMESYRGYAFRNERDMLVALLQKARSMSMSNICIGPACAGGMAHGVHIEQGKYVVFQGSNYASRDTDADETIFSQYGAATTSPASLDVVFTPLSATTSATTTAIHDDAGHLSTISINSEGAITWTN